MSIPKHAAKVPRLITIKDLFDKSGAVLVRCDKEWGGTHGFKKSKNSDTTYCGYKTKESAMNGWLKNNFGNNEEVFKMIKYLIARANKRIAP